ncbi:Transposase IS66 family protein [Enhygromyxa salina]|uniref:Transposase IS66 family protein n=1 Tax=Enhygromyxa salina TaxID=215803 RepID=A0A2S9YAQ1_9BACT|nr:transposase [Enhygromyxa salina]PRQ02179.1 Transposase IS66 family protein [Enhygromyxa salina]
MGSRDELNLDQVRSHLVDRLSKGEHNELVNDILKLLEKLGRRTAHLEFELMRLRKSAKGRTSEQIDTSQLSLLLSLVSEADKPKVEADDESETVDPLEDLDKFEAKIDSDLEEVDAEDIDEAAAAEGEAKKPSRRQRPPEHLPVEERVIDVERSQLEGCDDMGFIGYAESHTLDWRQGHFIHVHTKRAKYAPKSGDGPVVTAPCPPQVIVRGLAEPGLLTHVIVSKYADHLPLNRLVKIFARDGLDLTVSTMVGWLRACASLLAPLHKLLGQTVLASHVLQTDDTGVQVLDNKDPEGSAAAAALIIQQLWRSTCRRGGSRTDRRGLPPRGGATPRGSQGAVSGRGRRGQLRDADDQERGRGLPTPGEVPRDRPDPGQREASPDQGRHRAWWC